MAEDHEKKREFPRADCDLQVEYSSAETFIGSYMKQVGQGGLFIEQDDPAQMGTELTVTFNLPGDSHEIRAKGKVVWRMTNPTHDIFARGVGVKFIEISDKDREKIAKFVEEHYTTY